MREPILNASLLGILLGLCLAVPSMAVEDTAAKYVKKETWQETMLAVRAAFQAAGVKVDMELGSSLAVSRAMRR